MNKYTQIKYALVIAVLGFLPVSASAATVYLESSRPTIAVGDTVILSTKVNAEGTTINTIEGDVVVRSGGSSITAQEFSLANSAFGLWPRTPSLSKDGQTISFVGGVPGGFNIEGATIFKTVFVAKKEGTVTIAPQNIVAYANDGKGTKVPITSKGLTLTVTTKKADVPANDEWGSLVAKDITPPEDFIIVLGQDAKMFDNKIFAFFSALDNQSGISYYEVSENGAPAVRSGSTYVLQNQSRDTKLVVTAYDKANNKKSAEYPSSTSLAAGQSTSWVWIVVTVLVVIILVMMFKRKGKNKKNNASLPL
jgi:hypothetical protein